MVRWSFSTFLFVVSCSDTPVAIDGALPDARPSADAADTIDDASTADAAQPVSNIERCGLEAFAWRSASEVGLVVESTKVHNVDAATLWLVQAEVESQSGVSLARVPSRDVDVRTLRYITQDRGMPIEATGMVFHPDVAGAEEFPVLLWLHGTSGANDACGPSVGIEDWESDNAKAGLLLALFASYGYIVVAPDYIGMKASGEPSPELHPYLVGEPTAIAAWDAVRAAEALLVEQGTSGTSSGRVAVWGASQGGHAAGFAVRFGPHYAPEYEVVAGVYAVPTTELIGHAEAALTELRSATGNVTLHLTSAEQWYRVPDGMSQLFVAPYDAELQPALMASCSPDNLDGVTSLDELFTPELLAAAQVPGFGDFEPWACILRENSLTTTTVQRLDQVPGLFILSADDTLVDPVIERAAFATLCDSGMQLQYLECQNAGHSEGFFYSIDDAFDFIEDRLSGLSLPGSVCELSAATACSSAP